MPYSVNKLITNAFYLSKVRSKDFQSVGGDDVAVGLDILNKVLSQTSANTKMIPYYSSVNFPAVIGQELYFIPNLVEPFSLTFNMTTVRFSTMMMSRREYNSTTRIDGINALPLSVNFERTLGGSNMKVQFLPSDTYPFIVWGKFALSSSLSQADLTTDLLLIYDMWYIDYLEHWVAKRICNYYGIPMNPEIQSIIDQISANVNDMNVIDLTSQKINHYSSKNGFGWIYANLGHGMTPTVN